MKRTIALILLTMATLVILSGCNTIRGAGEDIEQGGQAIQRSANS
ncbi:MAG: entericidin A/B family lipoprotein [Halomonas sp.]|nr:entericidin A/B family lipoprotein [Halomonas sp.]TVP50034.1 MAG: entericidin A/B family lipoprotein [Halomonas sp.]